MRFLYVWVFVAGCLCAQTPTAEQVYKNIKVLKGTPADQLAPAMNFMAASLGVDCNFCHVQDRPEADDKKNKQVAREMIEMTNAINKTHFEGRREMTCFSCHHGVGHPASIPPVLDSDPSPRPAPAAPGPALTTDQIIERYVTALGGADAIRKVQTRVQTGVILAQGRETPVEVIAKAPNKRITVMQTPSGHSVTAYDGKAGWTGGAGPARDMTPDESFAFSLDAELHFALRLRELFPQLRPGRPARIGDVPCVVLNAIRPGQPPVQLYFAQDTGLLVRLVRYAESPLGRNPTQIDYADYREVDGVKIASRWTLARPNGRFTIQIKETKLNTPVDDARFAKPN